MAGAIKTIKLLLTAACLALCAGAWLRSPANTAGTVPGFIEAAPAPEKANG
ncbi:hypothetical protein [Bradyrhizobium guangxiense]|uniref:hypothetical protein n=1 Tax=Bradyrhizobium guangxiense TaxID=1325115 RepID=UPI0013E8B0A2|nr:hypothetical protein [Bradyrhizobium guangxiense]